MTNHHHNTARNEGYDTESVLVLRTCNPDMTSHGGFTWPTEGPVEAPDWNPTPHCGNGLHGLAWGQGNADLLNWHPDARWLVVEVSAADIVDLDGKVKYPRGVVVYCGDRHTACQIIADHPATAGQPVHGATRTAGHRGTATAGYKGTATAGDLGTATAGHSGTATAGYKGTATAGYKGTATAGYRGTATAGYRGTATAGYLGTATAGDLGAISILYWDGDGYRRRVAEVGDPDGLEPNVPYRLNNAGEFVKADQ